MTASRSSWRGLKDSMSNLCYVHSRGNSSARLMPGDEYKRLKRSNNADPIIRDEIVYNRCGNNILKDASNCLNPDIYSRIS